jgi:hypothetical protein
VAFGDPIRFIPVRRSGPHRLVLMWGDRSSGVVLLAAGWTVDEQRELAELPPAEVEGRFAVLPSDVVDRRAFGPEMQPVAGAFEIIGGTMSFTPRFPFLPGRRYTLLVGGAAGGWRSAAAERWEIRRPGGDGAESTRVLDIAPTAGEVPVNLLKLYVEFSAPMSEGWALRSLSVRRAHDGEPLEGVFLQMEPELWDPGRRRLTALLDPGRIKRGLMPNLEAGYPLVEGEDVIIRVDNAFRDAEGLPLAEGFECKCSVGPALRERVNPARWEIRVPPAGTVAWLTVVFDRPLDHALVQHCLSVTDSAGRRIAGVGRPLPGDRGWRFGPDAPWAPAEYALRVDPRLEDLAGNSVSRVFDRDLTSDREPLTGEVTVRWRPQVDGDAGNEGEAHG